MTWTLPLLLNSLAVGALWKTWLAKQPSKLWLRSFSFSVLVLSLLSWGWIVGPEYGITIWFIVSGIIALVIIGLSAESPLKSSYVRKRSCKPRLIQPISMRQIFQCFVTFLISFGLTLLASVSACLVLTKFLPGTSVNNLVASAFLFPALWSLACCWVLSIEQRSKPIITLISILVFSIVLLSL
ncbi:hypothetical protein [Pleionea sediminis]|uniref:hypothetical protein n=1 Tax=Pleionea sediminis TaxID=2569479 RepID=UPI001184CC48|nr:hypothetical protein [Pleionea sediminis]